MSPTISVMVLSGDRLFADALEAMLAREANLRVLMPAALSGEAEGPRAEAPDVVMIDATGGTEVALSRTAVLREIHPSAGVIVLGSDSEDERILDFVEAGASDYVLASTPVAGLLAAIRAVHSSEVLCSPRLAASVLERIGRLSRERAVPVPPCEALTDRELEVMRLLADGLQNKEIGRALRITVQTVKNHVHSILSKLGVRGRRLAVRRAYERGLLGEEKVPRAPSCPLLAACPENAD